MKNVFDGSAETLDCISKVVETGHVSERAERERQKECRGVRRGQTRLECVPSGSLRASAG